MATEILRKATQTVDKFEVGDQLAVTFPDREYTATAIQLVGDGEAALALLDDFLDEPYPMNREVGTESGYEASDARKHLQEIAEQLPEDFKAKLIPFENGDLLRLLTSAEMTGEGKNWNEADGQIEWMKDRRHRIATRKGNEYECGWTATPVSGVNFAIVGNNGSANNYYAGHSFGIRPAFQIKA